MPADRRERERALDPARSFIVQAPAGSGKTEVLTQRFLKLLAIVERPERVLAITFTRKATQEMRSRITARLAQARAGERPEREHDRQAVALAAKVVKRDRERGWNLIGNPGRLRITTIDGLCTQLLARDPVGGARWAGVQILEDARPLYRDAVRRVFSDIEELADRRGQEAEPARAAQDAVVRLLVHLGGDGRRLEKLLMHMLQRRALWKRHLGADHASLGALLRERQVQALEGFEAALGKLRLEEARSLAIRLGSDVDPGGDDTESRLYAAVEFARLLSTKQKKPRAPGGINRTLFPHMDEADSPALDRLREIYSAWHEIEAARDALERMASWPPLDVSGDSEPAAHTLLDDARSVLWLALTELESLMAETGRVDFTAVADAALESLGSDTEPAETLLAEDTRIDHILMDEFQDTSHMQFRLLHRLTAGWERGDGRSLFLVGDPMQSIYRFREANVGFFNEVVQRGRVGQVPVEPLQLKSNFRSRTELIDWFNQTFPGVFPARDEADSGAVSYTPVSPEMETGGRVRFHALPAEDEQINQGDRVAELVHAAREEPGDPSVAILLRKRDQAREITPALARRGIAFEAVELGQLAGLGVVRDLIILTRALLHPLDRVAWIALLRAPWCGLPIADVHRVVGDDAGREVLVAIDEAVHAGRLDDQSLERLRRLSRVMWHARRCAGRHSLARRVEMCWTQLAGPLCGDGASDLENAEVFLDLLEETEQDGGWEIAERVEEVLEDRYAKSRPAPVQIMTIHKAKGLEFDVVIVPSMESKTGGSRNPLIALQEFSGDRPFGDEGSGGVLMAPLTTMAQADTSLYRYLNRVDAERERFETQRVLYVACTRARSRLHLLAEFKTAGKTSPSFPAHTFAKLLEASFRPHAESLLEGDPSSADERQAQDKNREQAPDSEPAAQPLLRLRDPLPELEFGVAGHQAERPRIGELPDREAVALGTVVHDWLELIHDHPEAGWDTERIERSAASIRSCLAREGAPEDSLDRLLDRCTRILVFALNRKDLVKMIGKDRTGESWSELPIYRREGNRFTRHVIDLLVRDESGALRIVDYKTGAASDDAIGDGVGEGAVGAEGWRAQLDRYRELVESLGAGSVSNARAWVLEAKVGASRSGRRP